MHMPYYNFIAVFYVIVFLRLKIKRVIHFVGVTAQIPSEVGKDVILNNFQRNCFSSPRCKLVPAWVEFAGGND